MKLPWSKKRKAYPPYWQEYLARFKIKNNKPIAQQRFIAFDTETTGLDCDHDRILCIGGVALKNNCITVVDQLEIYLDQPVFKAETVKIHGIRHHSDLEKISESQALQLFLAYIQDAILVAHHANFDYTMVNNALHRQGLGKLKNKILDTGILFKRTKHLVYLTDPEKQYSLDELCNELNISKSDRHTAAGDAMITAIAFLKIVSRMKKEKSLELKDLFKSSRH